MEDMIKWDSLSKTMKTNILENQREYKFNETIQTILKHFSNMKYASGPSSNCFLALNKSGTKRANNYCPNKSHPENKVDNDDYFFFKNKATDKQYFVAPKKLDNPLPLKNYDSITFGEFIAAFISDMYWDSTEQQLVINPNVSAYDVPRLVPEQGEEQEGQQEEQWEEQEGQQEEEQEMRKEQEERSMRRRRTSETPPGKRKFIWSSPPKLITPPPKLVIPEPVISIEQHKQYTNHYAALLNQQQEQINTMKAELTNLQRQYNDCLATLSYNQNREQCNACIAEYNCERYYNITPIEPIEPIEPISCEELLRLKNVKQQEITVLEQTIEETNSLVMKLTPINEAYKLYMDRIHERYSSVPTRINEWHTDIKNAKSFNDVCTVMNDIGSTIFNDLNSIKSDKTLDKYISIYCNQNFNLFDNICQNLWQLKNWFGEYDIFLQKLGNYFYEKIIIWFISRLRLLLRYIDESDFDFSELSTQIRSTIDDIQNASTVNQLNDACHKIQTYIEQYNMNIQTDAIAQMEQSSLLDQLTMTAMQHAQERNNELQKNLLRGAPPSIIVGFQESVIEAEENLDEISQIAQYSKTMDDIQLSQLPAQPNIPENVADSPRIRTCEEERDECRNQLRDCIEQQQQPGGYDVIDEFEQCKREKEELQAENSELRTRLNECTKEYIEQKQICETALNDNKAQLQDYQNKYDDATRQFDSCQNELVNCREIAEENLRKYNADKEKYEQQLNNANAKNERLQTTITQLQSQKQPEMVSGRQPLPSSNPQKRLQAEIIKVNLALVELCRVCPDDMKNNVDSMFLYLGYINKSNKPLYQITLSTCTTQKPFGTPPPQGTSQPIFKQLPPPQRTQRGQRQQLPRQQPWR